MLDRKERYSSLSLKIMNNYILLVLILFFLSCEDNFQEIKRELISSANKTSAQAFLESMSDTKNKSNSIIDDVEMLETKHFV